MSEAEMQRDSVESLWKEFDDLMKAHDPAYWRWRGLQALVAAKFGMTATGEFRGNPTPAELGALDAAWEEVGRIQKQIDNVMERLRKLPEMQ
jgi:hypothetical protein